jgi:hypothetical protein
MTRYKQPEYNVIRLIENNFISYCSLIRRNAFLDSGGYDLKNVGFSEDYQLWLKMAFKGHYGIHYPEPLFYYRVRENSISHSNQKKMIASKAYFIKLYPMNFPESWQKLADEELKKWSKNFMSVK